MGVVRVQGTFLVEMLHWWHINVPCFNPFPNFWFRSPTKKTPATLNITIKSIFLPLCFSLQLWSNLLHNHFRHLKKNGLVIDIPCISESSLLFHIFLPFSLSSATELIPLPVPLHTTPIDPYDNGPPTSTTTYAYLSTYTHENTLKIPKQQTRECFIKIITSLTIIGVFSVLIWGVLNIVRDTRRLRQHRCILSGVLRDGIGRDSRKRKFVHDLSNIYY